MDVRKVERIIKNHRFRFYDTDNSFTVGNAMNEIGNDVYRVFKLEYNEKDVVVDIGANVGVFSIIMGKLFPDLTIYSFEPISVNYSNLLRNIESNNVKNIYPYNIAIGDMNGKCDMVFTKLHSGGSYISGLEEAGDILLVNADKQDENVVSYHAIEMRTLDSMMRELLVDSAKLLKLDCEGSEFNIASDSSFMEKSVEYMVGELHAHEDRKNAEFSEYWESKLGRNRCTFFRNIGKKYYSKIY